MPSDVRFRFDKTNKQFVADFTQRQQLVDRSELLSPDQASNEYRLRGELGRIREERLNALQSINQNLENQLQEGRLLARGYARGQSTIVQNTDRTMAVRFNSFKH